MGNVVFMEGFELYDSATATGLGLAGASYAMGFYPQDLIQPGRFGGNCLYINGGGGNEDTLKNFGSALTTLTVGLAFMGGGVSWNIIELRSGTGTNMIAINSTGTGAIEVRRGGRSGAVLGTTAAGAVAAGLWSYIEISVVIHASAGTVDIDVDGINMLSLTAQNTQAAALSIDTINFCENNAGGVSKFDDVYVRDDYTRLGPCRIESLRPTSDVAGGAWTPTTGTVASCLDETVSNGDTDYATASVVGDKQLMEFADLSGSVGTVHAVQLVTNSEKTDAAARAIKHVMKVGATEVSGPDKVLLAAYSYHDTVFTTAPDGSAWDATKVAAMQAGMKVSV